MKYIYILLIVLVGCAPINYDLKPTTIYTLEDGSQIKVYKTQTEKIYIRSNDFSVIQK